MLIIYIYLSVAKYAFVSVYFVKPIYIASMNEIYTKHMRTSFILVHTPLLLDSTVTQTGVEVCFTGGDKGGRQKLLSVFFPLRGRAHIK